MFITNRTILLLVLGAVLSSTANSTGVTVPSCTDAVESQITTPPAPPSQTVEKRANSAVTCSEWSILNNGTQSTFLPPVDSELKLHLGPSYLFTCRGEVNTCVVGSSTPYWHCGDPTASQIWYTSCYDFPAVSHDGNNNYWYVNSTTSSVKTLIFLHSSPQNRPYCGTWSLITGTKTYSTFGCDTTKADQTLVRRSTITVTSVVSTATAFVVANEAAGNANHSGSPSNFAAALAGSLVGVGVAALLSIAIWLCMKKVRKDRKARAEVTGSIVVLSEKAEFVDEKARIKVVEVSVREL
jgi:hypothetical protein